MAHTDSTYNAESYFETRMQQLGVTAANNIIEVKQSGVVEKDGVKSNETVLNPVPIFRENPKGLGIDILVYTLDRNQIIYKQEGKRWSDSYSITRLEKPVVRKDGSVQKYNIPKGQGTYPFFHPWLIEQFEKKQAIDTLYLVEGFFKAWKGCNHGIPVVGLSSITHMKEKDTGILHPDIKKLMDFCSVKKMVWLTDGDCLDITGKDLKDGVDLYRRPKNFYSSCETFKNLLDDYDVEKWFMHIDTDAIVHQEKGITRDMVKGLDDLLVTFPDRVADIVKDIKSTLPGTYFQRFNITSGTSKIHKYFHLWNVNEFYSFHVERRPEMKGIEFKFNGTTYKYNEEKNECLMVVPGEAKNYFRVGDQYYEFVWVPNKYHQLEKRFDVRQKSTIIEDYGKKFVSHIPKYKTFCNIPDHLNFQQVINGCFNVYSPFEWEEDDAPCTEADCPNIINFVKHVFGDNEIVFTHPKDKTKRKYLNYELALDYMQLLLQKPAEKLPILCLVSKENNTGKSTFAKLLKLIFTGNVAIVGNQDLSGDFNRHWATKLVVICDEAKIDKQIVVEKVKSLSTADKIMMNSKGKDHVELECFIKFIFCTNNEGNFIYLSEDDIRYWIIKVPQFKDEITDLLSLMKDEIPAFISFLNRRKLLTESLNRMWFHPSLLKTEALKKVIQHSMPVVVKELRQHMHSLFTEIGAPEIKMTLGVIQEDIFRFKYEKNYLEDVLKDIMRVDLFHVFEFEGRNYDTMELATQQYLMAHPEMTTADMAQIKKKYVPNRHSFPRYEKKMTEGRTEKVLVWVKDNGRPYVFRREMFLTKDEIANIVVDPELAQFIPEVKPQAALQGEQNDLPF